VFGIGLSRNAVTPRLELFNGEKVDGWFPLPIRKFGRSANHEALLAILIVVVDDQRIRPMYDANASDCVKHLIGLHIGKAERMATLDDLDDLFR
jgi:hypothetical protein